MVVLKVIIEIFKIHKISIFLAIERNKQKWPSLTEIAELYLLGFENI